MKLAAIYNVWDGDEHLRGSIDCIKKHVDAVVVVYSTISNYGEHYQPECFIKGCYITCYYPDWQGSAPRKNEIAKRNVGIEYARKLGCTHFLMMDCDEYYPNFGEAKQKYIDSGSNGSVCKMITYFKNKNLCFENPDNYYVPFIHQLNADTCTGEREYPFYVDPTRRINTTDVVEIPVYMHHFSWVRDDIERKVRNSSARLNIENSQLLADYHNPDVGPGYFVKDFNQKLREAPAIFP